jgi:hypothetical protein
MDISSTRGATKDSEDDGAQPAIPSRRFRRSLADPNRSFSVRLHHHVDARIQLGKAALQRGPELASHPLDRLLGAILRLVGELAQHLTNYLAL